MNNKIALVTGVSRRKGLGRAICLELARRGIDIFFTYWTDYDNEMPWKVRAEEPESIEAELLALGVRCVGMELDLTAEDAVVQLLQIVEEKLGKPSILINNATYSTSTSIETLTAAELDRHYALNMRATTLLSLEFIRQFQFETGGRIINISSGQSLGEMPDEIAYAITKGAIETFTRTISQRIAAKGITINAVNPGPTDTGWIGEELYQDLEKRFPTKRIGLPEDAARLIGFLCSEEGRWVTGQIIHSEGGFIRSI